MVEHTAKSSTIKGPHPPYINTAYSLRLQLINRITHLEHIIQRLHRITHHTHPILPVRRPDALHRRVAVHKHRATCTSRRDGGSMAEHPARPLSSPSLRRGEEMVHPPRPNGAQGLALRRQVPQHHHGRRSSPSCAAACALATVCSTNGKLLMPREETSSSISC